MRPYLIVCLLLGLATTVVGCGRASTPTPTATAVSPVVSPATPTTALPTATLKPPVVLAPPTPTLIPTRTPTPTPVATATPEAVILMAPEDFTSSGRNPLTGELEADPTVLQRRPIACKISNSPPEYVRPQSGLNAADLVFEHVSEGSITRFTAIFYDETPEKVGSIRSARLIDVELPAMYDAALCYSGSSIGVSTKLNSSDFRLRLLRSNYPGYYRTGEDKPWEHTLYAHPAEFWSKLDELQQNQPPQFGSQMVFSSIPPANGQPAGYLSIDYNGWTLVEWRWDADQDKYLRWADGEAFLDANDGQQVAADNVVIIFATHVLDYNICEFQQGNQCLSYSTEIQIWGRGLAEIFRDGQRFVGEWRREQRNHMFTFYTAAGEPLPLQIGNTWFQVVPYHYNDPVNFEP